MDRYPPSGLVFWAAIIVCILIVSLRKFFTERERQRTLRVALERGQPIDPELLQKIVARPERVKSPEGLQGGGIIVIGLGVGLAVMGYFISLGEPSEHNSRMGMLGVGLMMVCLGTGMLIASRVALRRKQDAGPPDARM
jgi:MFS family permease